MSESGMMGTTNTMDYRSTAETVGMSKDGVSTDVLIEWRKGDQDVNVEPTDVRKELIGGERCNRCCNNK